VHCPKIESTEVLQQEFIDSQSGPIFKEKFNSVKLNVVYVSLDETESVSHWRMVQKKLALFRSTYLYVVSINKALHS